MDIFVYSFIGWCGEAAMAAVHRHKFVNRGFVSGPICPVYGAGAAAVAVFLPELKDQLFFLFLGGMIVTTFVEYLTGRLLELIFHRKWWDYSDQRFNLDGYVCLKNSAVWGLCSVLMICFQPFYPGGFPRRYRGDGFLPGDYWKAHEQEQPGVRTIQHCVGACVRPSDMDPLSV